MGRAIYGPAPEGKLVAVLQASFDVSRSQVRKVYGWSEELQENLQLPPGGYIFALAGYVATVESWEEIDRRWTATLAREHIPLFRAYRCLHGKRPFQGWTLEKCLQFMAELVGIINEHAILGVGVTVPIHNVRKFSEPYRVCLYGCLRTLALSGHFPRDEEIALVFEEGEGVRAHILEYLDRLRRETHPDWGWDPSGAKRSSRRRQACLACKRRISLPMNCDGARTRARRPRGPFLMHCCISCLSTDTRSTARYIR